MSKMSAGMKKYASEAKTAASISSGSSATEDQQHIIVAPHRLPGALPPNPTALAPYGRPAVQSLSHIVYSQPQLQTSRPLLNADRVATTIRARMQSQAALRNLCLQTLQNRQGVVTTTPYYSSLNTNVPQPVMASSLSRSPDPTLDRLGLPASGIDLSNMSTLSLLQLRDLLSRTRGQF